MTTYDRAHLTPRAWGLITPSIMAHLPGEPEIKHPAAGGISLKVSPIDQRN
jgi:hypothetical protein